MSEVRVQENGEISCNFLIDHQEIIGYNTNVVLCFFGVWYYEWKDI